MKRNKAYKAFNPRYAKKKDGMYIVPVECVKTLYDGRYCAVVGFFFGVVEGKLCILANKRGKGTPDYQGYWNCPCGYLERGENSIQGVIRETQEECGVRVDPDKVRIIHVETEPEKCENGNVTIHHYAFLGKQVRILPICLDNIITSEPEEVEIAKWVPVDKIDDYKWAFGHLERIKELLPNKLERLYWEQKYK